MSTLKRVGFLVILTLIVALSAMPVWADGPEGDVIIWGDNYTLGSGQRIDGSLLVYGGNVSLEEDSEVDGDVTVFGGNLTIGGEIDGDVMVYGGNVKIKSDAVIRGSVAAFGGTLNREEGADVRGTEMDGFPVAPPRVPSPPRIPEIREHYRSWDGGLFSRVGDVFRSLLGVAVLVVLGILVVVFIPRHVEIVAETMIKAPVQSFVSGIAAPVVAVVLAIVLAITVCLFPVSAVILLLLGVAWLFGWIAAGMLFGVKVLRALNKKEPNRVVAVAIGIPILAVLISIPCIGGLIGLVVATWSLGAVVYSLFGTRAYNEPMPTWGRVSGSGQGKQASEGYDPRMDKL